MAQTFNLHCAGVAFAATKNMAAVLNGHATEVLKIREAGLSNAQTAAVTGVVCQMECRLYTGTATLTTPTAVTPVSLDTTNSAPTTATYGHAGTIGGPRTRWIRGFGLLTKRRRPRRLPTSWNASCP